MLNIDAILVNADWPKRTDDHLQKLRVASRRYPVRDTADRLSPSFSVALRAAFAVARKKPLAQKVDALKDALQKVLEPLLRKAAVAGGEAASMTLKAAEYDESKHPRDEKGQWTSGSTIFHGSTKDFESFDISKIGTTTDEGWLGKGIYFSTDQRVADYYPLRYETKVILNNPLRIKQTSFRDDKRQIVRESLGLHPKASVDEVTQELVSRGYDGVILDMTSTGYFASEVMALDTKSTKIVKKVETGNTKMWDERAFGRPDKYRKLEGFLVMRAAARKPLTMQFNAKSPSVAKWARKYAAELVTLIADTTRDRLRDAVTKHAEGLLTDEAYADALEDAVGNAERAEMIARTESMRAVHQGQREAWRQAEADGLIEDARRVWIVTPDDKLCPICEPLDGETADLDGSYGEFEGPPAHPNCRCTEGLA